MKQPQSISHKFSIAGSTHVGRAEPREIRPQSNADNPGMVSQGLHRQLIDRLAARGIRSTAVLEAMRQVPRHVFIEPGLASRAYEDVALPIGHEQTISQPFMVARMAELALNGRERLGKILEIGTGCAYQAAVLAQLAQNVFSIERLRALHELARANLRAVRAPNLRLLLGDGRLGWAEQAPFDAIVVAAAGLDLPSVWLEQLAMGGRLIAPQGVAQGQQRLVVVERISEHEWQRQELDFVNFVPLKSGVQ